MLMHQQPTKAAAIAKASEGANSTTASEFGAAAPPSLSGSH